MREITTHRVKPNDPLRVAAKGEPGPGGANAVYTVFCIAHRPTNDAAVRAKDGPVPIHEAVEVPTFAAEPSVLANISFQSGNPADGLNGVTIEALLAICADKLEGHQRSQFACAENATALTNIKAALATLKGRTQRRVAEGVEGTQAPDRGMAPAAAPAAPAAAPMFSGYMTTQPPVAPLDLSSDAPLSGACDLSGDGTCESCQ